MFSDWLTLQRWYQSPHGRTCQTAEKHIISAILPSLYGWALLNLGVTGSEDYLATSVIHHQFYLDAIQPLFGHIDAQTAPAQLPFANTSIDAVVLPHVLEFQARPVAVLQEVERVLIGGGHVLIIGFNLLSGWRLWHGLRARMQTMPSPHSTLWRGHLVSAWQLQGWLYEYGFETLKIQHYRFPLAPKKLPLFNGSGYVLLAQKRVFPLTPIKPRWQIRRSPAVLGLAPRFESE